MGLTPAGDELLSVDRSDKIDVIGIDRESGNVVLTINDHLAWSADSHLYLLQAKLDTYLAFVESGELLEVFPQARSRRVVINVVGKYSLDANAARFFDRATAAIGLTGIKLSFEYFNGCIRLQRQSANDDGTAGLRGKPATLRRNVG